jgi:hypothetical protein
MAKMRLEPVTSQPTLSPAQLANLSGLAAQDAITNAINSAAVQVAKENNISVPQASLIVQSEVNQSFQQPNYVPNIPASLVPSLDAYKASLNARDLAQKVVANQAAANVTKPSADTLANLGGTGTTPSADTNVAPITTTGNSSLERDATDRGYRGDLTDTETMESFITAANQAAANVTKPSADTLANLGGTGTAKVADTGTVIDNTKLNTQGGGSALATGDASALGTSDINKIATTGGSALSTGDINKIATTGGSALSTGDINKIATTGGSALSTGDINKIATSPAATSPPSTINTGSIPALTTADLTNWYNTQPKGITADQLKTALEGQQTALSGQNTEFLKNWNSSADALKTNILSGVDTKNQAFGTQATQGFMDAFKNFQIPTNQQTGVNLGNYNDNRNAAADQWWSQYVTGRR